MACRFWVLAHGSAVRLSLSGGCLRHCGPDGRRVWRLGADGVVACRVAAVGGGGVVYACRVDELGAGRPLGGDGWDEAPDPGWIRFPRWRTVAVW